MNRTVNPIQLIKGDITNANVDAVVNAASQQLLGGGGVDGAIHRAAGSDLLEFCKQIPVVDGVRCPAGEARITPAGKLDAKFVIHAVGPVYGIDADPDMLLASAYRSSLSLALENDCKSVALPAISCGVYDFPWDKAAAIALAACREDAFSCLSLTFFLFSNEMMAVWSQALAELD